MGGRGAFVNVEQGNFNFVEGGQVYRSIGVVDNIKVLVQEQGSVKAPDFSHSKNSVYAVIQKGALKHLTFYDKDHNQAVSIDLMHEHCGLKPHKHLYLNHKDNGIPVTDKELDMIRKVKRRFGLK